MAGTVIDIAWPFYKHVVGEQAKDLNSRGRLTQPMGTFQEIGMKIAML
jgi:hypothetical protein